MEKDFYLDRRWLASYFEKDWFDQVLRQDPALRFEFPAFAKDLLYSRYHEEFAELLAGRAGQAKHLLEIGSALGRTFYELCRRLPSLQEATLVEPSQNLGRTFAEIFTSSSSAEYPMLYGNRDLVNVRFDSRHVADACARVKRELLPVPWSEVPRGEYDLVVCSNVIDQCERPMELVEFLKKQTSKGGVLALSCTYQWNDKYVAPSETPIRDLRELFTGDWILLAEKDLEFRCRRSERLWLSFLSHACVFQRREQEKSKAELSVCELS